MTIILRLILLGLGITFIQLVWTLTDPRPRKGYLNYLKQPQFLKTYLAQIGLLVPQVVSGFWFPWNLGEFNQFIETIGLLIFYLGIILAVWAKLVMKQNWGVPGQHDTERQKKLVTDTPFSFTRNPIYLGLLLLGFGFSLCLRSYFIILTYFLFKYFSQVIRKEEKLLQVNFGSSYRNYRYRTPRWLFFK